jgi:hypothetical protein
MPATVLDYARNINPQLSSVSDDDLTLFIGDTHPDMLGDEAFNKRYEAVKGQRQARADQAAFDTTAAGRIARASNAVGDAAYTGAAIGKRLWLGTKQGLEQGLPSAVGGLYDFFGADGSDLRLGAQEIGREYQAEGERIGGGELAQLSQEFGGSLVPSFAAVAAAAPLAVLGAPTALVGGATVVAAGLISGGSAMADAIEGYKEQGLSERDAIRSARLPAAATGLATGVITRLGMKFGGDLESTLLGMMTGKVASAPLKAAVKVVLAGMASEATEEALDQTAGNAIAKASYRPGMTAGEFISDVAKAALFGAATRGMLGAVEVPARVLGAQPPAAPPAQPPSPDTTQPAPAAVTQPAPAAVTQPAPAAVTQPAPAAVTQPSTAREDLLNQALIEAQKVKPKKKKQDNKARVPLPPAAPLTEAEVEAARSGVAAAVSSLSDLDRFPAAPIGLPAEPETPADLRAALPPDATRTEVPPPPTITGSNAQAMGAEMPVPPPSPEAGGVSIPEPTAEVPAPIEPPPLPTPTAPPAPAPKEQSELDELQELMLRRGQAQNKIKGVKFLKKDEKRFKELSQKYRDRLFETTDPENDPVVGVDINGTDIRQSKQGTFYTVENGRVRSGPAFSEETPAPQPATAPEATEVTSTRPEAETAKMAPPEPPRKPRRVRREIIGDVLDAVELQGRMMSASRARATKSAEWWKRNKSLYNDAPTLPGAHNFIYGGNLTPDQVLKNLQLDSPGTYGYWETNDLWAAIAGASKARKKMTQMRAREDKFAREDARQALAFDKATKTGEIGVRAGDLAVGDVLDVEGETLRVTDVDPDTGDVLLEDGSRFGRQRVSESELLYVEQLDKAETSTDFLGEEDAAPETPADLRAALPPDATRTEVPPPQTITGSNEQTGSEMPVSPQPESAGGTTFPEFQPETIPLPSDDELIAESRERRRRVSVFPAPERQPRLVAESGKALLFPKAVADYLPNLLAGVEGIRWRQRSKYNVVGEIPHKWLGILASRVQEAIGPAERASAEAAEAHKNAWDTTTSAAASSAKYLVSDLKELRRTLVDEVPAMWEVEVRRGGETLGRLQIAAENGKDAVKEARHETFFGKAFGGDFVGSDERKAYRFKSKRREDLSFPMESAASAAAEVVPPAELLSNLEQEIQQLELQDQTEGLDAAGRARLASLEVEMQRQAEAPNAELPSDQSNEELQPEGNDGREVLQGAPPVERAGDQRLVVEGGLGDRSGVGGQQEGPPQPRQADGGAAPVAVRDAPAARVTAAVEDLPPELSYTFDLGQAAEFAATASPEAESGIQLLGQHADLIVSAAQSTGITPRIWLSSAVGGSGFAASSDGSTLFFDPAAFATALPTMLANAKNAKASGTKSYFARFTEGLKTLIDEEMIHLASYRALREEHAESGDTRTFEEWIADLERGLVESAPALAASVRALYGFDTEFLGAEMLRMYLQWARHTEGEQIFTESGDTFFRAGKRNIERNLIKAFKGTDRSTLLGQAFDWIVGRFRKDEAARVREIGNRVLKFIEKARKAPEPKRGRPAKSLDTGSVQALYESSKARLASMSPEEQAAFEQAEALYQQMLVGGGLYQAVLKKLQSPGMLNAYPSELAQDIARYAAMRNILTSLNKLAGKATTFAELFGKGGIDFNKSINYAVGEAASDPRISEPDPTDPEGKRRRFLPSAFSEESLDKRREDFNQEVEDLNVDVEEPLDRLDPADVLDTAQPEPDAEGTRLFDRVWSEVKNRASVFGDALRAGGQDEHAAVFERWADDTNWRQLTTLRDFGDRVQAAASSLEDDGELLMEAVAAFGRQREVRGLLGRLAGVEADEPLGPRAASPGELPPPIKFSSTGPLGAGLLQPLEAPAADLSSRRLYLSQHRKTHADLSRLLEKANDIRVANGEEPLSLSSEELPSYASSIGLTPEQAAAQARDVLLEKQASRIAGLTARAQEAADLRQRVYDNTRDENYLAFANANHDKAMKALRKALVRMNKDNAESAPEILQRARVIVRAEENYVDQHAAKQVLNGRLVKNITRAVGGDDSPLTLFTLLADELNSIQQRLRKPLPEDAKEEDILEKERARGQIALLQQDLAGLRRSSIQAEEELRTLEKQRAPLIEDLQQELRESSTVEADALNYINDLLRVKKGGTATGTLLPQSEIEALRERSAAVARLIQALSVAEDGTLRDSILDVMLNPPARFTPAKQLLITIGKRYGKTRDQMARDLGVTLSVLEGVMEDAMHDPSIAEMAANLAGYFQSRPYVEKFSAITDPEADIDSLLSGARWTERTIRRGVRRKLQKLRAHQVAVRKQQMTVDFLNRLRSRPEFQQVEQFLDNPPDAADTGWERMVEVGDAAIDVRGFEASGVRQGALTILPQAPPKIREHQMAALLKWRDNAKTYIQGFHKALGAVSTGGTAPDVLGYDLRVVRGLQRTLAQDFENIYVALANEAQNGASAPFGLVAAMSPDTLGVLGIGKNIISKVFAQPLRVIKHIGVPIAPLVERAMVEATRVDRGITASHEKHPDIVSSLRKAALSHGKKWDFERYDQEVFQLLAREARQFKSPVKVGYVLPSGHAVTADDIALLKKLMGAYQSLSQYVEGIEEVDTASDRRRVFVRKARPVGDYSVSRREDHGRIYDLALTLRDLQTQTGADFKLEDTVATLAPGTWQETFWDSAPDVLLSYVFDSERSDTDRVGKFDPTLKEALKKWAQWVRNSGNYKLLNGDTIAGVEGSLTIDMLVNGDPQQGAPGLVDLIGESETEGRTRARLAKELTPYIRRIASEYAPAGSVNQSSIVTLQVKSNSSQFTRPAAKLQYPSGLYRYGSTNPREVNSLFSSPRMASEIKVLNLMKQAVQQSRAMLDRGEFPKGRLRSIAQFRKMVRALELVTGQFEKATDKIGTGEDRLTDFDIPVHLRPVDLMGYLTSSVLAAPSVVLRNGYFAQMAPFLFHSRIHGVFAGLRKLSFGLTHFTATTLLSLLYSSGSLAAEGVDALIGRFGGRAEFLRTMDGFIDRYLETSLERFGLDIRRRSRSLADSGMQHRPKLRKQLAEVHALLSNDLTAIRNAKGSRRAGNATAGTTATALTIGAISAIEAVKKKIGIDVTDKFVNVGLEHYAKEALRMLEDMAITYGRHMEKVNGADSEFDPLSAAWQIRPDRNVLDLSSSKLQALRDAYSLGMSFERVLWDLYQDQKLSHKAGLAASRGDAVDVEQLKAVKGRVADYREDLKIRLIEEMNSPGRFNRSLETRVSEVWRALSPLQGYTGDHFLKILEFLGTNSADDDAVRKMAKFFYRLLAYLGAAAVTGLVAITAGEKVKRKVERRSTGMPVLGDPDFNRDMIRAFDHLMKGEIVKAGRSASQIFVGMASAIPYAGDFMLIGLDHYGITPSRGHLLDVTSRSLYFDFVNQAFMAGTGVLAAATEGHGVDTALFAADDFLYRWTPYYGTAGVVAEKLGVPGASGSREKYLNTLALRRDAVASGLTEPRRSNFSGAGYYSTLTVFKRRLSDAMSARDREALTQAFSELVNYYRENKRGGDKRSRSEAVRLARGVVEQMSPVLRGTNRARITRQESVRLRRGATGERRGRIDEALQDYAWGARRLGADVTPEIRNSR